MSMYIITVAIFVSLIALYISSKTVSIETKILKKLERIENKIK